MTNLQKIVAISSIIVVLLLGTVLYNVFKTPAAASGPITAIPLTTSDATSAVASSAAQSASGSAVPPVVADTATTPSASSEPTSANASSGSTTAVPLTTTASAQAATATNATGATGTSTFTIVPDQSKVRFSITEVLNGAPKTAVGTTNQVAGELAINAQDPTQSRVGTIQVDARTLATDNDFRNRAIKNQILQTDQYEFITFTPTGITGLPHQGTVGQSSTVQIAGNLTIRNMTKPVTFAVTVMPTSATQVKGTATATINRSDFGLTIPQVRQVANVGEQVQIAIDFVAAAK